MNAGVVVLILMAGDTLTGKLQMKLSEGLGIAEVIHVVFLKRPRILPRESVKNFLEMGPMPGTVNMLLFEQGERRYQGSTLMICEVFGKAE